MKVYIIVKETDVEASDCCYTERENVTVYLNEQDANFDLKHTYKSGYDVSYYLEVFDV